MLACHLDKAVPLGTSLCLMVEEKKSQFVLKEGFIAGTQVEMLTSRNLVSMSLHSACSTSSCLFLSLCELSGLAVPSMVG